MQQNRIYCYFKNSNQHSSYYPFFLYYFDFSVSNNFAISLVFLIIHNHSFMMREASMHLLKEMRKVYGWVPYMDFLLSICLNRIFVQFKETACEKCCPKQSCTLLSPLKSICVEVDGSNSAQDCTASHQFICIHN